MLPRPAVRSILSTLPQSANGQVGTLDILNTRELLQYVEVGLRTFGARPTGTDIDQLRRTVTGGDTPKAVEHVMRVVGDHDVLAVQRVTQALLKGFFGSTDCVRITTVVSEIARNIYMYAKSGDMKLSMTDEGKRVRLDVLAVDRGPGIANLEEILEGRYVSKSGLGKGLLGAKRIFDELSIDTGPEKGTTVRAVKRSR